MAQWFNSIAGVPIAIFSDELTCMDATPLLPLDCIIKSTHAMLQHCAEHICVSRSMRSAHLWMTHSQKKCSSRDERTERAFILLTLLYSCYNIGNRGYKLMWMEMEHLRTTRWYISNPFKKYFLDRWMKLWIQHGFSWCCDFDADRARQIVLSKNPYFFFLLCVRWNRK